MSMAPQQVTRNSGRDDRITDYSCIECDACKATCSNNNHSVKCERCELVFYCGAACREGHWNNHERACVPIETNKAQYFGMLHDGEELRPPDTEMNSPCGICLTEPINNPVALSKCNHAFCFQCITGWQEYQRSKVRHPWKVTATCPLCRRGIEEYTILEQVIDDATMWATVASKRFLSEQVRMKFCHLAITHLDKWLTISDNDIAALALKGQVLRHIQPREAIRLCELVIEMDKQVSIEAERYAELDERLKMVEEYGEDHEISEVMQQLDEVSESMGTNHRFVLKVRGPERLFDLKIALAEAHESIGGWMEACILYTGVWHERDHWNDRTGAYHAMCSGLSRCCFQLNCDHKFAIEAGNLALALDRHAPGGHKQVALPQRAAGDLSGAIKTMSQALLYEVPWDDENRQQNLSFLEELKGSACQG